MSVRLKKKDSPKSLAFDTTSKGELINAVESSRDAGNEFRRLLLNVITCSTNGKEQLASLKDLCVKVKQNMTLNQDDVRLLCWTFIRCSSRHPLRRTLASLFESLEDGVKLHFMEHMSIGVVKQISCTSEDDRRNVELITALMENFKNGDAVIRTIYEEVLKYLVKATEEFIQQTKNQVSPADQTLMMHHSLASLKTIIAVLQKTQEVISSKIIVNSVVFDIYEVLIKLLDLGRTSCMDEFLFLECRSAGAMIIPSVTVLLPEESTKVILNKILVPEWNSVTDIADLSILSIIIHNVNLVMRSNCLSSQLILLHAFMVKMPFILLVNSTERNYEVNSVIIYIERLIYISGNSHDKHILVFAFKAIAMWATLTLKTLAFSSEKLIDKIFQNLIPHLLNFISHQIDAVRHSVNAALRNCFELLTKGGGSEIINTYSSKYFSESIKSRGKLLMLKNLSEFISVSNLIKNKETLPYRLLSLLADVDLSSHSCELYKVLAEKHLKENPDSNEWMRIWVNNTYEFLESGNCELKKNIVEYVIPSLLKMQPRIVEIILESSSQVSFSLLDLRVAIVVMKAFRSMKNVTKPSTFNINKREGEEDQYFWKGVLPTQYMLWCCVHIDEQVQLDTLALICSSAKSTDTVDSTDIQVVKYFLEFSMVSENPSFRQQVVANIKKLFIRIFAHAYQVQKQNQLEAKPFLIDNYIQFTKWFVRFLFDQIYCDAPYCQISLTLELLYLTALILKENNDSLLVEQISFSSEELLDFTQVLLTCFCDTYDPNRSTVLAIFQNDPIFVVRLSDLEILTLIEDACGRLLSPQPDISSVAAYLISYACLYQFNEETQNSVLKFIRDSCKIISDNDSYRYFGNAFDMSLSLLDCLMLLLKHQLSNVKKSILAATEGSPLFGVLNAIRLLCMHHNIDRNNQLVKQHVQSFKKYLKDLVHVSLEVVASVSEYVSADAPEGYICDDASLAEIFNLLNLSRSEGDKVEMQADIARMLLVCCWRSLKEISLLLGAIVSDFTMSTSSYTSTTDYLPKELLEKIWEMFCDILLRSKHAGAYELASVGFIKLCKVLWNSSHAALKKKPEAAVELLIQDLLSPEAFDYAQVTRRSAGLPFYLKAICATEPAVCGKSTFSKLMVSLIKICRNDTEYHDINKIIIALNILRAFFKDTSLGEDVTQYVSDGIIIAISGFSCSMWAVRNSATLLFSSLMQRVFGVKKVKCTGREFFSKYPALYDFLLEQAKEMTSLDNVTTLHPSIFPVLLLLSHLYPSSVEGAQTLMNLSDYIPYVTRCSESCVYKTRTMAARALVPLVSKEKHMEMIHLIANLINSELEKKNQNQNRLHGYLLQLKGLISGICGSDIQGELMDAITRKVSSTDVLNEHANYLAKSTYLEIVQILLNKWHDQDFHQETIYWRTFKQVKASLSDELVKTATPGSVLYVRNAARYLCAMVKHLSENEITDTIIFLMRSGCIDAQCEIIKLLNGELKLSNTALFQCCVDVICVAQFTDLLYFELLPIVANTTSDKRFLIKLWNRLPCETQDAISDDIRTTLVKYLLIVLRKFEWNEEQFKPFLKEVWRFIHSSSLDVRTDNTRLYVAKTIGIRQNDEFRKDPDLAYRYYHCCINLLQDSAAHVRDEAATSIYEFSKVVVKPCTEDTFYKPHHSYVFKKVLRHMLAEQLKTDTVNCTLFLLSLIARKDFWFMTDSKTSHVLSITQSLDKKNAIGQLVTRTFKVFEASRTNPYFDEHKIQSFSLDLLQDFYSGNIRLSDTDISKITQRITFCERIANENKSYHVMFDNLKKLLSNKY